MNSGFDWIVLRGQVIYVRMKFHNFRASLHVGNLTQLNVCRSRVTFEMQTTGQ